MRSTVIPAQITTVKDTIAGNLTFTQILLLIMPILISTGVYVVLPQRLAFTFYKIPLMIAVSLVFILLSLRIRGRIGIEWVSILAVYILRPHLYVYDKNTLVSRSEIPNLSFKVPVKVANSVTSTQSAVPSRTPEFDYKSLLQNTDLTIRFTRKGFLVVKSYD